MRLRDVSLALVLLVPAACRGAAVGSESQAESRPERVLDLSHPYDSETVYWPTAEGFRLHVDAKGVNERGFWYEANSFSSAEHGGTHLDAPVHFAEGKRSVDEIPLAQLIGPGIVVDVRAACAADRDHRVAVAELESWERRHGPIPDGAIVLLHTGFGRFWPDRVRYLGTDERGPEAVAKLHFPGLHPDAARWLVARRSIGAVGLDTASIDHGLSKTFDAHRILSAAEIPALENVAGLEHLPPTGCRILALPMKIRGGSGAPVRIAALLP